MKLSFHYKALALFLGIGVMAVPSVWAQTESPTFNGKSKVMSHESHVEDLANRFQVEKSDVIDLRNQRRGWGEISTELAFADHLT